MTNEKSESEFRNPKMVVFRIDKFTTCDLI